MPETEMNNKIRLNQARRDAFEKRLDRADGIKPNMSSDEKLSRRNNLYGKDIVEKESKRNSGKFAKTTSAMGVAKKAKDLITAPTEIQAMDIAIYGVAFSLALFKDLLDLAFIGSLPAIGTIITICISMAIGFVLLFDGISNSQRKVARRLTKKFLVLIAGTMAEGILFGLNFFPIETLTVFIIFWMSLADRKRSARLAGGNEYDAVYN
ncbi:MAG: hypothetical protein UR60_C0012G0007 [Candidatus Moranbacteria bacterium GW2011_GWF2_34_56]|nr:MAG: hypothetical protein UR51_C0013G0013 [Candidatus Moranbacteria bacterium GW2011_GWF1_34_10]KKP64917.1 MAG: hypothetical protein UR60_C0012G0007 [Candidatus Moranbacteria bacterium GW2011_GWF2_34_56]HBI17297.1 hypothetical protein [Candidatus Moranbacteria bacterium]